MGVYLMKKKFNNGLLAVTILELCRGFFVKFFDGTRVKILILRIAEIFLIFFFMLSKV